MDTYLKEVERMYYYLKEGMNENGKYCILKVDFLTKNRSSQHVTSM